MPPSAEEIIRRLRLRPHPEGVHFRETYRARGSLGRGASRRNFSTAIYCLIRRGDVSRLHRVRFDELWHFYLGGPVTIVELRAGVRPRKTVLGSDLRAGQVPQHCVPARTWFGAFPNPGTSYALVGCTVAPGFDFADFELGRRAPLLKGFPTAKRAIMRLT